MNWPGITSLLARFGGNLHKDVPLASGIEKNQSKIDTAIVDLVEALKPIE